MRIVHVCLGEISDRPFLGLAGDWVLKLGTRPILEAMVGLHEFNHGAYLAGGMLYPGSGYAADRSASHHGTSRPCL
jgi:hypothetical protein